MKKLDYQKNYIYVNKENGNAGHEILLPDNADLYVWAKCAQENYDKWKDSNNQKLIDEEIINTLATIPQTLDSESKIDITTLNIQFSDNVYSFANLMKDSNITLFNNVDLINKDYLLNQVDNNNDNIEDATIIEE